MPLIFVNVSLSTRVTLVTFVQEAPWMHHPKQAQQFPLSVDPAGTRVEAWIEQARQTRFDKEGLQKYLSGCCCQINAQIKLESILLLLEQVYKTRTI